MKPNYRYEFAPDETAAMVDCLDEHGFAIAKQVLTPAMNDALKASIRGVLMPDGKLANGGLSALDAVFVERSPELLGLFRYKPFLDIARAVQSTDDFIVHRSAAIVRVPGDNGMCWHSDYCHPDGQPGNASEYLNTLPLEQPNTSMWFYLTGCNPTDGGLAIIPDSHRSDWTPGKGCELSKSHRFINKAGEATPTLSMDFPGVMPVVSEPGDLLLFSIVTFHGVFAHHGSQTRLSCGMSLRRRSAPFAAPWPLTPEARGFIDNAPADLRRYVDGYVGLNREWQPQPAAA